MTARLLVTGSRLLTAERHADAVEQGLAWCGRLLGRDTVLVHGAGGGLDALASERWSRWGLLVQSWPADWGSYGVAAGSIRDADMVASLGMGPALCMAWPHPDPAVRSAGTWGCVALALAANVTVLNGWTLQPILSVPELPPAPGPDMARMPHHDQVADYLELRASL